LDITLFVFKRFRAESIGQTCIWSTLIKHIVFNDNKIIDHACRNDINNCACLIVLFCGEKYFLIKVPNIRNVYISKYFYKYKV
jgi:hypothetical protein